MFKEICTEQKVFKTLLDGEWVRSDTDKLIEIKSPVDGSLVGKVQAMSREEVDKSLKSSKEAQKKWRALPLNERAEYLYKAADILEEHAEEIADVLVREVAKDKKSSLSEVIRTADLIRFTADTAKGMKDEALSSDRFPGCDSSKIGIVKRDPLGVVLAISPFNYPINLAASKIAPALVAGNTVVLKPATQGCVSGLHLARVFEAAGLPKGVLNTITGRGSEIGDYCVTHKDVDFINFTGSTQVGQRISGLTSMKPLLMELGGKDAAVVLADADLDLAASKIVGGAYSYSGQRCTAIKRVLVVDSVADELVAKMKPLVEKLKIGNPIEEQVDIVPLINGKSADFVEGLIKDAEEKGATLVTGGKREGNYIFPTLFDHVTTDMDLAWEEPFGPVLPVIRVKDKEEAIKIANESEYGLQSSVFTSNMNDAFDVAEKLEVGTVQINDRTQRGPDHFPFLGVKSSGMGTQGIRYSIESMTRPRLIVLNIQK